MLVRSLAFVLALLAVPAPAHAQSLWNRRTQRDASPYDDERAPDRQYVAHDIITIVVRESTDARATENTQAGRETEYDVLIDEFVRVTNGGQQLLNAAQTSPEARVTSSREQQSRGSYQRRDRLATRIAATVVDVLPNGHIVIEAERTIVLGENEQIVRLSGTIDPRHIDRREDTIPSDRLADLSIRYDMTGVISDPNRRGWFARLWDWFWPL